MNSYQKLKVKIKELESDIHTLITEPNFIKVTETKCKYQFQYDAVNTVMAGSPNSSGNGIIPQMLTSHFKGSVIRRP